ncbi:MAG TPA: CvpA family protein [Steroidobacteraceae bacterium]|jgi:membrane protein required for colicin V production|nr:CvpA family protein [Steroidobacteraceae bacterium]
MNWLDYLLIALVVFSIIAGLTRGLLRESIGLVAWVIGVWSAFHFGPALEPYLGGLLTSDVLRPWVARLIVFLIVVLVGSMIGTLVAHFVRLSMFSGMDRFWGGFFGLVRGLVVVGAFVILCHGLRLQTEPWWQQSTLAPHAERIANILRSLVGERKITSEHPGGVTG